VKHVARTYEILKYCRLEVLLGKIKSISKAKRCGSENRHDGLEQATVISCCKQGKKTGDFSNVRATVSFWRKSVLNNNKQNQTKKMELQLLTK